MGDILCVGFGFRMGQMRMWGFDLMFDMGRFLLRLEVGLGDWGDDWGDLGNVGIFLVFLVECWDCVVILDVLCFLYVVQLKRLEKLLFWEEVFVEFWLSFWLWGVVVGFFYGNLFVL